MPFDNLINHHSIVNIYYRVILVHDMYEDFFIQSGGVAADRY